MASKSHIYTKMINSMRWRKLRALHLAQHPFCAICERDHQIVTPATEVHHIEPVESAHSESEQSALMFNPGNLMSLCHYCHKQLHTAAGYHTRQAVKARKQLRVNEALDSLYGSEKSEAGG